MLSKLQERTPGGSGRVGGTGERCEDHGHRGPMRSSAVHRHPLDDLPKNLVGAKAYASDPHRGGQEARRRDDRASPEEPDTPEDAGRAPPPQVQTALDRRVVLRLASVEPSRSHPMGVSRRKLSWIRPVRGAMPAAQAALLLKQVLQLSRAKQGASMRISLPRPTTRRKGK